MKRRNLRLSAVLLLCVGLLIACGGEDPVLDLNGEELLTTDSVVSLLNGHAYELSKVKNPSEDLLAITIEGRGPAVYEHDGEVLLIYEYENYPEAFTIQGALMDYLNYQEERPVKGLLGETGLVLADIIQGKNIALLRLDEDNATEDKKFTFEDNRYSISDDLFRILFENAFNGQQKEYYGENENWEVVAQVFEYDNQRFQDGRSESDEFVRSLELFKYKNGPIEDAGISAMKVTSQNTSWSVEAAEGEALNTIKMGDYWCFVNRSSTPMGEITIELTGPAGTEILELSIARTK